MALAKVQYYEGFRLDLAQTKCMHHPPQCGGDNDVLTWGNLTAQAMVGAKAPQHHDGGKEQKKFLRKRVLSFWYDCT